MDETPRTFRFRVLATSWGIAIDLTVATRLQRGTPDGAIHIVESVVLVVSDPTVTPDDVGQLGSGLARVAGGIARTVPPGQRLVVDVIGAWYNPCDYQPEGMAAAMVAWATERFALPVVACDVRFDGSANRYVFDWGSDPPEPA